MDDLSPHEQVERCKRAGALLLAGRKLLGWDAERLGEDARVSVHDIARAEQGNSFSHQLHLRYSLMKHGVVFMDDKVVLIKAKNG